MNRLETLLIGVCAAVQLLHGQYSQQSADSNEETLVQGESKRYRMLMNSMLSPASDLNIDVKYYKLNLSITTSPKYLQGVVTMKASSLVGNLTSTTLDLMSTMIVDSVKAGNTKLSFLQQPSTLTITLDRSYTNGELVILDIYYRGVPGSSGFGSFTFTSHAGTPWVYTLSEPYGAKDWWPCKDHPSDKADSVDIWVTVDSTLKVGSEGRLVALINNGNGTKTYRWAERYPISTYLVSVAITNYAEFTNWFKYTPTDSMPVLNYVLPEHLSSAQAGLPKTLDMLRIYSDKFALYPFINEKYGHCEFGWGGGMEHQTMTSLGSFSENLVAHELAHMWFGDMITCANWPNIWLNEGFATYSVGVYLEAQYGASSYWSYMNNRLDNAKVAAGSVFVRDTANENSLFDGNLVYSKGAAVLHMLRHVLGDSVFFESLRAYASDHRYRFGTATTENFKEVCETVSGIQLDYFFNEWIYGENYPRYVCSWSAQSGSSGYDVTLRVNQTTGTTNPSFFTMPIDCRLAGAGWDTTVIIFNSSNDQQFTVTTSHKPDTVQLDPQNWILRDASSIALDKPLITVTPPSAVYIVNIDINSGRRDTTFLVSNTGGAPDSIDVKLNPMNVLPASAVSVSPTAFALAAGSSQTVTFTIKPALLATKTYYYPMVMIDSRFAGGTTHFERRVGFTIAGTLHAAEPGELPKQFSLAQNYPNPFNPTTVVRYQLPVVSNVKLLVYDIFGREVSVLVNEKKDAGVHEVNFDASNLASGVYFCRLSATNFVQTRKIVLLR